MCSALPSLSSRMKRTRPCLVIDQRQGLTEPGKMPRASSSCSALAKEPGPLHHSPCQLLEIQRRGFLGGHQEEIAALVFQKQVLGMRAGNFAPKRPGFLDGKQRRVIDGSRESPRAAIRAWAALLAGVSFIEFIFRHRT